MQHLFAKSSAAITVSATLVFSACSSTPVYVSVPEKGPKITEINQVDQFPIGQIEDESAILAQANNEIELPKTEIKERTNIFDDEIRITWVQNGSGIDLLKVNQSLNDTWQLLNEAIFESEFTAENVNEQFGSVTVLLVEPIDFLDATHDSFSISKSKSEERYKIEFRVDAIDDGTVISLQFEDDLLLPADDNLIHLDIIRELMTQE